MEGRGGGKRGILGRLIKTEAGRDRVIQIIGGQCGLLNYLFCVFFFSLFLYDPTNSFFAPLASSIHLFLP